MNELSIAAADRRPRPLLVFVGGAAAGLAILLATQILSESRISFGPYALNGNGALAVPFIGFPLAIYVGWTILADRCRAGALAGRIAIFTLGLALGAGVMGLVFALPMSIIAGAVLTAFSRAEGRSSDRLLWTAFVVSAAIGALPVFGLFGVGLLPGSLISLARGKTRAARIGLGVLLAVTAALIVFGVPALLAGQARPT